MWTTLLAYVLVGFYFATDGRSRKGQTAKSMQRGRFDQASTAFLGAAYAIAGVSLLLAPVLTYLHIAAIPIALVGWVGLFITIAGIALRYWAVKTLGEFYTRTLLVTENQPIVRQGPYQVIRHPGYLGSLLVWVGAAFGTLNWIAVVIAVGVMFTAYYYRIQAEEKMLATASAGRQYDEYRAHTWKLIPFVF